MKRFNISPYNDPIYKGFLYRLKDVNIEYKIKVNFTNRGKYKLPEYNGRISKLVGIRGLIEFVGIDLANKFISRANKHGQDIEICKMRRGMTIRLYRH